MMKHARVLFLGCLALALLWSSWAGAQAPTTMAYQGRLLAATGAPVTAATSVAFRIYAAASGGTALWTETRSVTPDANGVFTIDLGATTPLTTTIFDGTVRYLGLQAGADAEMTPRQALSAVPYALRSGAAAAPASIEGVANNGGNIDLIAGAGLSVTGSDAANTITLGTAMGGMHPIAYGVINSNGTINNDGSANWTVTWNASVNGYEVAISGFSFNLFSDLAFVQGMGYATARMYMTDGVSNHLLICPRLHDGTVSQFLCCFIVYDFPGMKSDSRVADLPPGILQSTLAR